MASIPESIIESNYDIAMYKIAKYMNHQRSVYRTDSSLIVYVYSQDMDLLECITFDKIVRNLHHSSRIKTKLHPECPYLPTIIITILCGFDSYLMHSFKSFTPIAFGIEYLNVFNDFQVFMVHFPKRFIVWENLYK